MSGSGAAGGAQAQSEAAAGSGSVSVGAGSPPMTEEERFQKAQEKFQAGSKPSALAGSAGGAVKKANSFAALNTSDSEDE